MPKAQGFSSKFGIGVPHLNAVQAQALADQWVTDRWALIAARQEAKLLLGHYWQGLPSHSVVPAYTGMVDAAATGGQLTSSPSDQPATWLDVLPEVQTDKVPGRVTIDVYNSPSGKGWTLTIELKFNGDLWQRVKNVGPETWRELAWHLVPPPNGINQ